MLSEAWAGGKKYFDGVYDATPWEGGRDDGIAYSAPASQVFSPDNFFRSGKAGVQGGSFLVPSEALVKELRNLFKCCKTVWFCGSCQPRWCNGPYLDNEINQTNEKNKAVYAKLNFGNSDDTLLGNIGLRYVEVDNDTVGALTYATPISADLAPLLPADDVKFSDGNKARATPSATAAKKLLPSFSVNIPSSMKCKPASVYQSHQLPGFG